MGSSDCKHRRSKSKQGRSNSKTGRADSEKEGLVGISQPSYNRLKQIHDNPTVIENSHIVIMFLVDIYCRYNILNFSQYFVLS